MTVREDLQRLCPRPARPQAAAVWDGYVDAICGASALLEEFGATSSLRWAHLVATWAHETGGFTILWESGAYSAARIVQVFGPGRHSARVGQAEAERLAGHPYELFERVYGLGNMIMAKNLGNRERGDGYNFRGLGIQQLTGRWAHETYASKIGCALQEMSQPINSIHGALLEWRDKACNEKADRDDVTAARKAINGGKNGLDEVIRYVAAAKRIWPDGLAAEAPAAADEPIADDVPGSARDVQTRAEEHADAHGLLNEASAIYATHGHLIRKGGWSVPPALAAIWGWVSEPLHAMLLLAGVALVVIVGLELSRLRQRGKLIGGA